MMREESADVHKVKTVFPKAIRVLRETARIPTGIITAVAARLLRGMHEPRSFYVTR